MCWLQSAHRPDAVQCQALGPIVHDLSAQQLNVAVQEMDAEDDEDDVEPVDYDPGSVTHYLLQQQTPRLDVAVIMQGGGVDAAAVLASARGVLEHVQTRPHHEQLDALLHVLSAVRASCTSGQHPISKSSCR